MPDYGPFIEQIQGIAERAVAAGKPVHVVFGTVHSASPLVIVTEQKMTLKQAQLVLTRNVTNHWITIDGERRLLYNGLQSGEKVAMLREQGGQRFVIMDRVVGT